MYHGSTGQTSMVLLKLEGLQQEKDSGVEATRSLQEALHGKMSGKW